MTNILEITLKRGYFCLRRSGNPLITESRVPTRAGIPGKMREVFPVKNFKILGESQGKFWQKKKYK